MFDFLEPHDHFVAVQGVGPDVNVQVYVIVDDDHKKSSNYIATAVPESVFFFFLL